MTKILVAGAGGPASEGVIRSLRKSRSDFTVIGMGADREDLVLSSAARRYLVPHASNEDYVNKVIKVIEAERPQFLHAQNDREVLEISRQRDVWKALGVKTFLPKNETVEICVDKWQTYIKFQQGGVRVPRNVLIRDREDLQQAFKDLGNSENQIWLRSNRIGGGGIGALPTSDIDFAERWIDHHSGWNQFIAAELLSKETVTWLSIWHEGQLIVAQTRKRGGWVHGNRTLSGVTGVTKVGITYSSDQVNEIARQAIISVDKEPHGIFGVDMTYDDQGIPNPTEINIGRFFTTIQFFTEAGLNMPEIYVNLGVFSRTESHIPRINPLPDGLMWFRGMDTEAKILSSDAFLKETIYEL